MNAIQAGFDRSDLENPMGGRAKKRTAASTSLMGGFETEILMQPKTSA
jgi:hypothetical protein